LSAYLDEKSRKMIELREMKWLTKPLFSGQKLSKESRAVRKMNRSKP